jgi:hypothetical protein
MVTTIEVLRARPLTVANEEFLQSLTTVLRFAKCQVDETTSFAGKSEWLILYGVGAKVNDEARDEQVKRGGHALLWDFPYIREGKSTPYRRFSIDHDHPQRLFDQTIVDGARWSQFGVELREDFDPDGPIILVGLGHKSRLQHGHNWEYVKFKELRSRFKGRRIIYRPKKAADPCMLPCERDSETPIAELLKGAALAVCRHSNVAVDATIAGVPFEAQDGAAMWLKKREFNKQNRLEFLHRLAWFQWKADELTRAWAFARGLV